eukprot:TRINITY_DN8026_c0_g2_i1.p1 TRINITY_DN8026_c0_g2~~TRINITY_DN8026_c0_g2_i1.p1  ORF type:complete len:746 (+),score=148.66 TRINITY_DN8026_c0_g2_i1:29-2266(+)
MNNKILVVGVLALFCLIVSGDQTRLNELNRRLNRVNQAILDGASDQDILRGLASESSSESRTIADRGHGNINIYSAPITFRQFHFVTETVVFGIALDLTVRKSEDSMMTWQPLSSIPSEVKIAGIRYSQADPNSMVFIAANKSLVFTTTDMGATVTAQNLPFKVDDMHYCPMDSKMLFARNGGSGDLYFTKDFWQTYSNILKKVSFAQWCGHERICYIGDGDFKITDNYGQTSTSKNIKADYLIEHPKFLFVLGNSVAFPGSKNLFVSVDNGTTLKEAMLPKGLTIPSLAAEQILDDRDAIWLAAPHGVMVGGTPGSGDVYVADFVGYRFTLAKENVVYLNNWWDFDPFRSLEGTYFANVLIDELELQMQTQITYDNGDHWATLKPPTTGYNNRTINCAGCTLNLFGRTTWLGIAGDNNYYGDFWTTESAVGIVMATGNVGPYLYFEPDEVFTYLSSDGGVNWSEVGEGSMVYEFGDHGGILVMVPNQVSTKTITYSLDFGKTWTDFEFATDPTIVVNIFTTSSHNSRFVIFSVKGGLPFYYGLDFSVIFGGATCGTFDYETWELTDEANQKCILGHDTTYLRRKPSSQCDSPDNFNFIKSQTNCNCTVDDYECDYGYEQTISGKCVYTESTTPEINCVDGHYLESQGYRRVPGDTCVNPLAQYEPISKDCKDNSSSGSGLSGGAKAAIAIFVLLVLAFAGFIGFVVVTKRTEWLKDKLSFLRFGGGPRHQGYSNRLPMEDEDEI